MSGESKFRLVSLVIAVLLVVVAVMVADYNKGAISNPVIEESSKFLRSRGLAACGETFVYITESYKSQEDPSSSAIRADEKSHIVWVTPGNQGTLQISDFNISSDLACLQQRYVIFAGESSQDSYGLYEMDLFTRMTKKLFESKETIEEVEVRSDSSIGYRTVEAGDNAIYLYSADSLGVKKIERLTTKDFDPIAGPVFSRDGSHFAFTNYKSGEVNIDFHVAYGKMGDQISLRYGEFPTWGDSLNLTLSRVGWEIITIDLLTGEERSIQFFDMIRGLIYQDRSAWSPNGKWIAIQIVRNKNARRSRFDPVLPSQEVSEIYITDANGDNLQFLGEGNTTPVWSQSGKFIAWISIDENGSTISIVER